MIDSDDSEGFELLGLVVDNPFLSMIFFGIAILICIKACSNEDVCSKMHCDKGHPELMHHECLCVTSATSP